MPLTKDQHDHYIDILNNTKRLTAAGGYPPEIQAFASRADRETLTLEAAGHPFSCYLNRAHTVQPHAPLFINIHGGGWYVGHEENDTYFSAWLADRIGGVVFDVDYTTTASAPWPVMFAQCVAAAQYALAHAAEYGCDPARISIGGYSAGGHLTSAVMLHLLQQGRAPFAMQALCYSPADMSHGPTQDPQTNFEKRSIAFEALVLDGDESLRQDPVFNPACAADSLLAQFPATLFITAGKCPFRDQDEAFAQRLIRLGVETTVRRFPEASHGFIPHFTQCWEGGAETLARHICAARA